MERIAGVVEKGLGAPGGGGRRTNKADQIKLDLAKGSNDNTQNNNANVSEHLHVGRGNAEGPGREQGDDSVGGLAFQLLARIPLHFFIETRESSVMCNLPSASE